MTGLNLHQIAGSALAFVNPWRTFNFIKTFTTWTPDSRKPLIVQEVLSVQGKLQPANLQTLAEMGYTLREYQYWRVYLDLNATQIDKIRQFGADTFTCDGGTYRITDKSDWQQNGWTEAYCYLDKQEASTPIYTAGNDITLGNYETDGVDVAGTLFYGLEEGHAPLDAQGCIDVYNNALALYNAPASTEHQEYELIAIQNAGTYQITFNNPIYLKSFGMKMYSTNAKAKVTVIQPNGEAMLIRYQGNFVGSATVRDFNTGAQSIIIELEPVSDTVNSYIAGFQMKGAELL